MSALRLFKDSDFPARYATDIRRAALRAVRLAEAKPPLDYKGIGMTAVVFCDRRGIGYKVARHPEQAINRTMIAEEAEWLRTASAAPELRGKIARLRHHHSRASIIERECIFGDSIGWRRRDTRREVHQEIAHVMRRYGWSAPEFKDDSYIYTSGRGWVLVDASMPHRTGSRLAARAGETLKGHRFHNERPSDLAWEIRMEAGKTLPEKLAMRLSERLLALPDAERFPGELGQERDPGRRQTKRGSHTRGAL